MKKLIIVTLIIGCLALCAATRTQTETAEETPTALQASVVSAAEPIVEDTMAEAESNPPAGEERVKIPQTEPTHEFISELEPVPEEELFDPEPVPEDELFDPRFAAAESNSPHAAVNTATKQTVSKIKTAFFNFLMYAYLLPGQPAACPPVSTCHVRHTWHSQTYKRRLKALHIAPPDPTQRQL